MDQNITTTITETADDREWQLRRQQFREKQAAAERRLVELAERALALPSDQIDAAFVDIWNDDIIDDVEMWCVLTEWTEELYTADPGFVRHVFEARQRWLA